MKAGSFCLIMRKQELTDRLWFRPVVLRCTALHRLDCPALKEHTAAMTLEGGEADDPQSRVDLRAEIHNFQHLTVQRRALIDPQPLGVHIGEDAAEGVVNELLQRRFFQLCQCLVAIVLMCDKEAQSV